MNWIWAVNVWIRDAHALSQNFLPGWSHSDRLGLKMIGSDWLSSNLSTLLPRDAKLWLDYTFLSS